MIPFSKVIHTAADGVETNLNEFILDFNVSLGTEAKKNSITLNLKNPNNALDNLDFQVDESSIVAYLDWSPITSQNPLISATVSSIEFTTDSSGKAKVKIKATDKSGIFLSKLWSQTIQSSSSVKADAAVRQIVGHLNDLDGGGTVTTTNVATTKSNGAAFSVNVDMAKTWKPGYEWLNELSQPEYTGEDRAYVYWIDENNDLHWVYPFQKPNTILSSAINSTVTTIPVSSTSGYPSTGTFVIDDEVIYYAGKTANSFTGCTRGYGFSSSASHVINSIVTGQVLEEGSDDIYKLDISTTDEGTYNFIIYNAGETPQGYEYLGYTLDYSEVGKKFKMKFYDWKQIANDITNNEKLQSTYGDATLSYPSSYPYTCSWEDATGSAVTVSNDSEYQDAFITEMVRRAENKASAFFVGGQQRYKASVQMRGNLNFSSNELVSVVSHTHGQTRLLRIKSIKHQLNKSGWITDLDLETDIDAIGDE